MFGINKETVREMVQDEVKALHKKLGKKLYGYGSRECLNLYQETETGYSEILQHDFKNGIIGKLYTDIENLKDDVALLTQTIVELNSKPKRKVAKKKTYKKSVTKITKTKVTKKSRR